MLNLRRFCIGAALGLSLLACAPAYGQTNLIKDGGFENAAQNLTVWSSASGAHIRTSASGLSAFTGSHLAVFRGALGTLVQTLTNLTPSAQYRLTGYLALSGRVSAGGHYIDGHFGKSALANLVTSNGSYHQFSRVIKATRATEQLAFLATNQKARLDHLGLYPVAAPEVDPEAGAPALALALGGLALMTERRRKRPASTDYPAGQRH